MNGISGVPGLSLDIKGFSNKIGFFIKNCFLLYMPFGMLFAIVSVKSCESL